MSLISKRYRFPLISKDTYNALTQDEREQVGGDLHVAPPRTGQLSSRVREPFYDHLRSLGLSDSSFNSSVRSVRVFVKWLAERELLKHPVTLKALRTVKKRVQFYSAEQIQIMLDYCRETPGRRYTSLYRTIWILSQTAMRGENCWIWNGQRCSKRRSGSPAQMIGR